MLLISLCPSAMYKQFCMLHAFCALSVAYSKVLVLYVFRFENSIICQNSWREKFVKIYLGENWDIKMFKVKWS